MLTLLAVIGFCWLFTTVVVYIIIALVLTLIGLPIKHSIARLPIGRRHVPEGIAALITLVFFFVVIYFIGFTFLPPLITEATFLSKLNFMMWCIISLSSTRAFTKPCRRLAMKTRSSSR